MDLMELGPKVDGSIWGLFPKTYSGVVFVGPSDSATAVRQHQYLKIYMKVIPPNLILPAALWPWGRQK
jgi:hypothetical protein